MLASSGQEMAVKALWSNTTTAKATKMDGKRQAPSSSSSPKTNKSIFLIRWMGHVLRCLLLDLPVWLCFGALCASLIMVRLRDDYWLRQFELETWNDTRWSQEFTYYGHYCTEQDQTAFSIDDPELMYLPNDTATEARRKMLTHGATLYPRVLSEETAREVREFIVKQNRAGQDMIHVIQNENRYSFAIRIDQHPSIGKALEEILIKPWLVDALEAIMGPDPSIIELTGITATYGAKSQEMHADVVPAGSSGRFARKFAPSYSLFIPLQNTTSKMGATYICPGTHVCFHGADTFCDNTAPQASGPNDNWPTGWGALMNQQTMHKGAAHVDKYGPDRVLFIITFAPRPLFDNKRSVETRMLGTGGSYSLHWSNWGHTLQDFQHPSKYMTTPWRQLRALGLYKPEGRHWGWDFWTVTHQRIAQTELGYGNDYLLEALDKGVLDWIPPFIRGPRELYEEQEGTRRVTSQYAQPSSNQQDQYDEDEEAEIQLAWKDFADHVVTYFAIWAKKWYQRVLLTVVAILVGSNLLFYPCSMERSVWRPSRRLLLGHVFVAAVAWIYYQSIEQGTWARNIRQGLAFNTVLQDQSYMPDLPGTLINQHDVLITSEYQSDYLASYTDILDYRHEGNRKWRKEVEASYVNYDELTVSMKKDLCQELTLRVGQQRGRFATKNRQNQWSALTPFMAMAFCDRELQVRANPSLAYAVKWTDYLISEFRFGYWRQTRTLKSSAIAMLQDLQSKLLKQPKSEFTAYKKPAPRYLDLRPRLFLPLMPTFLPEKRKLQSLPYRDPVEEPYLEAWLQVGDVVEGQYQGMYQEWYKGTIISVSTADETWTVKYADGELDRGLCKGCVRRFFPFSVGELVAWLDSDKMFKECEIVRYHPSDNTFIVKLLYENRIILGVKEWELRRGSIPDMDSSNSTWQVGDRVMTYFSDEGTFPGRITKIDSNNDEYEIVYSDGETFTVPGYAIIGSDNGEEPDWAVGDEVAVEFPGMAGVFAGLISRFIASTGEYEIQYEDGDIAIVSRDMILALWDEWNPQML